MGLAHAHPNYCLKINLFKSDCPNNHSAVYKVHLLGRNQYKIVYHNTSCSAQNPVWIDKGTITVLTAKELTIFVHSLPVTCDINDGTVNRSGLLWVYLQQNVVNESDVIVHHHCPFDYCKPETVKISLNHSDEQCAFNHSGILCGGCREGLSATFGGSRCMKCSNFFVGLLAVFVAAGILLTALLSCLQPHNFSWNTQWSYFLCQHCQSK